MTGFCLDPMPLGSSIERKQKGHTLCQYNISLRNCNFPDNSWVYKSSENASNVSLVADQSELISNGFNNVLSSAGVAKDFK